MNNLLINKIHNIQDDYCNLLENIIIKLAEQDNFAALDEINIFWHSKFEVLRMYLIYYGSLFDSYIFTGATYLDIKNNEHLPFLLVGDTHIFDDPLYLYADIVANIKLGKLTNKLREQIIVTAKDNIEIIKKSKYNILILPVSVLGSREDKDIVDKQVTKIFLDLFSDKFSSLKDYFNKCNTIKDIEAYLTQNAIEMINFSEDNIEHNISFQERFLHAVSKSNHLIRKDERDATIFFELVYGYFTQALVIMLSCVEFNVVPYIRSRVTFQYFLLLSQNMIEHQKYKEIIDKAHIAYVVHYVFDRQRIPNIDMLEYISRVDKYSFSNNLFKKTTVPKIELSKIENIVKKELETIYCEFN